MKRFVILLFLLCSISHLGFTQNRVNREKESFTTLTHLLGITPEWELFSDGTWHKSKSSHSAYVDLVDFTPTKERGFYEIRLVSFNVDGQTIYAFAYKIGYWSYYYPHIKVDSHYYTSFSYYFISLSELSKILSLEDGEVSVSFYGYLSYMDDEQDKVIQQYKKGPYTHDGPFLARIRITEQDGAKVIAAD